MATGSLDGTIFVRDLKKVEKIVWENLCHSYGTKGVSALAFSNDSKLLYSGGYDGTLFVWSLDG